MHRKKKTVSKFTLLGFVLFVSSVSIAHVAQGSGVAEVGTRIAPWSLGTSLATAEEGMEWSRTYGGAGGDGVFSGIQTADGGFVFAGATDSYGMGGYDAWLVKIIPLDVPTVTVESLNGGEDWQAMQTITWTAIDPQGDPLTYLVYYRPNGGQTWTRLTTGLKESSYLWDTTTVVNGVNYLIRVEATDGTYIGVGLSNGPFKIANEAINTAPTVTETRSEAFFVPSFRVIEAIGALFVLLGLGKMQRRRKM